MIGHSVTILIFHWLSLKSRTLPCYRREKVAKESEEKLQRFKEKLAKSSHFYSTAVMQPVYSNEKDKKVDVNSNSTPTIVSH